MTVAGRAVRALTACGVLGPLAVVVAIVAAGSMRTDFEPASMTVSELASDGAPTADIAVAGFVLFGVLVTAFAFGVHRQLPGTGMAAPSAVAVVGVATIALAFLPCRSDCLGDGMTFVDAGHATAVVVGSSALVAAPLLVARRVASERGWTSFRRYSVATAVATAILLAAWTAGFAGGWGGAVEHLTIVIGDGWVAALGGALLRRRPPY